MKIVLEQSGGSFVHFTEKHIDQIKNISQAQVELISSNNLNHVLPETDILIYDGLPGNLDLKTAKNLKWIHITSAGANGFSDLLKNTKILLTNSSGVAPIPIAEHVFGFMLMFSRELDKSFRVQLQEKKWIRNRKPFELAGKTMGIVGYGRIGQRVAKLAKGFEMKVIALSHNSPIHDVNVDEQTREIDTLLKNSDFVVNCLPLTHQTKSMFTLKLFQQMKHSAYFINIGRGQTVVEKDLIYSLNTGVIAGAGLDVFEVEPLPKNSPLWEMESVILTPHYSGWTPKYTDRVVDIFCDNLKAYVKGEPLPNLVDKEKGY